MIKQFRVEIAAAMAVTAVSLAALFVATAVMAASNPFLAFVNSTASITTGNVSANVQLKSTPQGQFQVRVANNCATWTYIRRGVDNTVAATTSDVPLSPNEVEVFTFQNTSAIPISWVSMISPGGSCTVAFTTGDGF